MFGDKQTPLLLFCVVLTAGLVACGEDPPATPTQPAPPPPSVVTSVTVTPDGATLVSIGETVQLAASAFARDGEEMAGQTFTWTSSNETIATVDESGLVSAVVDGRAQIEASTAGVVGSASVAVQQEIASIALLEQPRHSELLQPVSARVAYLDAMGSPVAAATEPIEVSLSANPAGGTLAGTTVVAPEDGFAEFTDLRLDRAGSGYTLFFKSQSAAGVESDPFDVSLKFGTLSAGTGHTCAVSSSSKAYCWGSNGGDRLGHDLDPLRPGPVVGRKFFTVVESGFDHNCALGPDADALCWGSNGFGQLGRRDQNSSGGVPDFVDGDPYDAIDAGRFFTCGVTTRAQVECWGSNAQGQLGDGTTNDSPVPVAVASTEQFTAVSTGYGHACALTTDGAAWCWGDNSGGQLGDGTKNASSTPVAPLTNETFRVVSAGVSGTCGVTFDDKLLCWGTPLGQPAAPTLPSPVSSPPLFDVSMGLDGHACAIATSFQAYCWGENGSGQLGNATRRNSTTPVLVHGGFEFENIFAGDGHTCAVTDDRDVYCWGANTTGQLGNGSTIFSSVPVRVTP